MATKHSGAKKHRRTSPRERARRLLGIQTSTLTLYSAYLVVLIRLAVILFHGGFPHSS